MRSPSNTASVGGGGHFFGLRRGASLRTLLSFHSNSSSAASSPSPTGTGRSAAAAANIGVISSKGCCNTGGDSAVASSGRHRHHSHHGGDDAHRVLLNKNGKSSNGIPAARQFSTMAPVKAPANQVRQVRLEGNLGCFFKVSFSRRLS